MSTTRQTEGRCFLEERVEPLTDRDRERLLFFELLYRGMKEFRTANGHRAPEEWEGRWEDICSQLARVGVTSGRNAYEEEASYWLKKLCPPGGDSKLGLQLLSIILEHCDVIRLVSYRPPNGLAHSNAETLTWEDGHAFWGKIKFKGSYQSEQLLRVLSCSGTATESDLFRLLWQGEYPTDDEKKLRTLRTRLRTAISKLREQTKQCWSWTPEYIRAVEPGGYTLSLSRQLVTAPPDYQKITKPPRPKIHNFGSVNDL